MDVYNMIKDFGFPVFVSIFLLVKTSKDTNNLTQAINELTIWLKKGG